MANRYYDRERPWWRDVDDEDSYGRRRNRSRYEQDRDYGWQAERDYGYGQYGQDYPRRYDQDWEGERNRPVQRGYGYGDYGHENERRSGHDRDYGRRQRVQRGYGYGDYGQDYPRRRSPERGYERDWQTPRGYGYGAYEPDPRRRFGSERRQEQEWQSGRGYDDYDYDYGSDWDQDYDQGSWSYTEVWLIPGPATGRGPQGYQRSNERLVEDACERLTQHGQLDASNIEIEADNGVITLKGTVNSRWQKRMAEDTVETVSGVRDVRNELQIEEEKGGW